MMKKLSRRDFLKMTGITSASLLLSACGVKVSELPTATSLTSTSTPFSMKNLVSTSTPAPTNTATVVETQTATPTLRQLTLRELADVKGIKIFAVVLYQAYDSSAFEPRYKEVVLKTANGLTIPTEITGLSSGVGIFDGVDWNDILDNWTKYEQMLDKGVIPNNIKLDWRHAEKKIRFAKQNRMEVMAFHLLPEGDAISDKIIAASKTKDDFTKIMKFTIKARALHFKGRIKIWSGPNEIVATRLYGSGIKRAFVKNMVDNALIHNMFVWLKEADPNTIGLLSESNVVEASSQSAYQRIHNEYFKLLDYLIAKGSPVDGGGMHNHFWVYDPPKPEIVQKVIQEFKARGKVAYATETTVNLNPVYPLWKDRPRSVTTIADVLDAQAKVFAEMLEVFTSTGNIFGMFGVTDAYDMYNDFATYGYTGAGANIFDKNFQEKPAYKRMWAYLQSLSNPT